jgi:parallel beta-helix repeat protein
MQNRLLRKGFVLGLIFLFLCVGIASGLNFGIKNDIISNFRSSILYVGGDGPGNYSVIQDAINDTVDGDTVFVYENSSPYNENIVVNKSIFLVGENKDTTVIDGNGVGDVIHVNTEWIYIREFTIQNGELEFPYAGIHIRSNYGMISYNNIENNFYGIVMFYSEKIYIYCNNITNNNQCGIYLEGSSNNYISSNFINNQPFNGVGLYNSSNNVTIFNNTILNNGYSGIRIIDCSDNFVNKNFISKNLVGVRVEFSSDNTIIHNNFIKNIFWEAYHLGNKFFLHKNIWIGNYWNRPRLLPKPIFGRTGLFLNLIPWINIDWNPAEEPLDIGVCYQNRGNFNKK